MVGGGGVEEGYFYFIVVVESMYIVKLRSVYNHVVMSLQ